MFYRGIDKTVGTTTTTRTTGRRSMSWTRLFVVLSTSLLFVQELNYGTSYGCQAFGIRHLSSTHVWTRSSQSMFPLPSTSTTKTTRKTRPSSTALSLVFHRLSNDCIAALQTAQEQAVLLKLPEVNNRLMLLGIVDSPQNAKATLDSYGITWQAVRQVINIFFAERNTAQASNKTTAIGLVGSQKILTLSDFAAMTEAASKSSQLTVPYSLELQRTLQEAGQIAQSMGSTTIHSEHVLLALLEYKEVDGQPQASGRGDNCAAMELIEHIDATLDGEEICLSLLQSLMEIYSSDRSREVDADRAGDNNLDRNRQENSRVGGSQLEGTYNRDSNGSVLLEFGVDLTQKARDGKLDVVHERDEEIWNCIRILVRRRKKNACLIGEPGVGKSAVVEGIAQVLVSDKCPALLEGYRIVALELGGLIAGTKYRGEFEERLRAIIKEATDRNGVPTILFLDEIHTLVGSGSTEGGGMDAAGLLKPALARGELQILGATTFSEYQKYIAKDAALERRLQPVVIKEPSVEQTISILQALQPSYERHHGIKFMWESIVAAAKLSDRYIGDRFLPDKAIDVLDEAGSLCHLKKSAGGTHIVDAEMVANVVSEWSNIPVGKLGDDDMDRLQGLEEEIASRVKGQERAVKTVVKAVRRARSGMRNPKRPIASLLMCGVTGTGKTELCKTLADTYYGSEKDMIRIDMSEYMEKHSVSRLTGPPPGYDGYDEGGQLTEAVRRAPHSLVLLDEVEKAHPDVLNILLQVMEDGILTDGKGRTICFKNTILVLTSNTGSKRILELTQKSDDGRPEYSSLVVAVKRELEATMKPELLNRIDEIVVFEPLSEEELTLIAAMMVVEIAVRAQMERGLDITVTRALTKKIVREGRKSAGQFGARPMRRAVQRIVEDPISDAIVQGFLVDDDSAVFDLVEREDALDGSFQVVVTRSRDHEMLYIDIEESNRDTVVEQIDTEVRVLEQIESVA